GRLDRRGTAGGAYRSRPGRGERRRVAPGPQQDRRRGGGRAASRGLRRVVGAAEAVRERAAGRGRDRGPAVQHVGPVRGVAGGGGGGGRGCSGARGRARTRPRAGGSARRARPWGCWARGWSICSPRTWTRSARSARSTRARSCTGGGRLQRAGLSTRRARCVWG